MAIGKQTAKCKNYDIIGIERVVSREPIPARGQRKNFIKTSNPIETFVAECSRLSSNAQRLTFARTNLVEMHWGLIPVEYKEGEELKRRVFHVLRVVPQPGLHLLNLIRQKFISRRNEAKPKETTMIGDVCHCLQQVINYEADINYGMEGVWNSKLPNPWTVTDPVNATSVERILSPFTVLKRLLHHIPGGWCGMQRMEINGFVQETLVVEGFPDLSTPESAEAALDQYNERQELYLAALRNFEGEFEKNNNQFMREPDMEVVLSPVLKQGSTYYNLLPTKVNMIFTLQNFMKFAKEKLYAEADRITIPKLGIALIDHFIFFENNSVLQNTNTMDFITAHVGEQLAREVVTETRIAMKYRVTDVQSLEDFPKAGQHKSARDGYKRNAAKLLTDLQTSDEQVHPDLASFYHSYLLLQFTTTMNGLLMDSWMSDRVYRSAVILDQLVGELCPCKMTKEALMWSLDAMSDANKDANQLIMHDESAFVWSRINSGLCKLNETVRANPLNLSIIWGMLKSDVLTFLGLHNQTWRWIMFCMQIAPCFGHLRTQTEDGHAARGDCILTAKPNSVGLNEVIVKTVNYCLEGLMSYVVALSEEDRRVLRLDKVDRKTRAGMEASQGVELANGRIISKPTSSNLMQAVAVDEALRSFDESALAALINTGLPRDSNAGEGSTHKILKPERGHDEKGQMRQLPGMGWYVLCFATNTNARNPIIAEMLKTLACGAMITYAPGAPQSQGLATALTVST